MAGLNPEPLNLFKTPFQSNEVEKIHKLLIDKAFLLIIGI
jgi:hypothetical protein